MPPNKSLKVRSSLRFVTDSPNRRMLRILCAACVCPLALRYASRRQMYDT